MARDDYYWARAHAFKDLYFSREEQQGKLKVLDYGCGLGQASAALEGSWGFDASAQARSVAKQHGMKVLDSLESIPKGEFDIVICRHVLEHLVDPAVVLKTFHTYLKSDGTLKLILPKEKHRMVSFSPDDHLHLHAWNFRTINNLLSICGFQVQANQELYHWGFSKLMPVHRLCGKDVYLLAAKLTGFLFRASELVIIAKKN